MEREKATAAMCGQRILKRAYSAVSPQVSCEEIMSGWTLAIVA